jgi:hypothetical protein
MGIYTVATALLALTSGISGFSVEISRRQAIQAAMGGVMTVAAPSLVSVFPANAVVEEETPRIVTRMGGLLVRSKLLLESWGLHSMHHLYMYSSIYVSIYLSIYYA